MQPAEPKIGGDKFFTRQELHRRVTVKKRELKTRSLHPLRLTTRADLDVWLVRLTGILTVIGIPKQQWVEAAILFIEDEDLNASLRRMENAHFTRTGAIWLWHEFTRALDALLGARSGQSSNQTSTLQTALGVGLAIGGAFVAAPVVGVLALNAVGFTAGGVAAGSLSRTVIRSAFYNGLAKGLFSACQSIGTRLLAGKRNASSEGGDEDVPSDSDQESTPAVGQIDEDVPPTSER